MPSSSPPPSPSKQPKSPKSKKDKKKKSGRNHDADNDNDGVYGLGFQDRLNVTLVVESRNPSNGYHGGQHGYDEQDGTDVFVDVEDFVTLNRQRDKERNRQRRRNKKQAIDNYEIQRQKAKEAAAAAAKAEKKDDTDDIVDTEGDEHYGDVIDVEQPQQSSVYNKSTFVRSSVVSAVQGRKVVKFLVLPASNFGGTDSPGMATTTTAVAHKQGVAKISSGSSSSSSSLSSTALSSAYDFAPLTLFDIEKGKAVLVTAFEPKSASNDVKPSLTYDIVTAKVQGGTQGEKSKFVASLTTDAPFQRPSESPTYLRLSQLVSTGQIRDLQLANPERGVLGGAWRGILRRVMMMSLSPTNALQLGRQLEFFLPILTGHESYMIGELIQALDEIAPPTDPKQKLHPGGRRHRTGGYRVIDKREVDYVLVIAFKNRNVSRIIVRNIIATAGGTRWDFVWHWYQQISHNRLYDIWSLVPVVGITGFPATENFPATRNHALASTFRLILGPGNWITRVLTQNRQGLNTDDPTRNVAQNLSAEVNNFELANRNQFGTYFGRMRTNEFRLQNRLPADESIVRSFITSPQSTMVNNGVVHLLRQVSKHWYNMLNQQFGSFAHQRMEQLDPFETMRFHMPSVCLVLSSLRGRNVWDAQVLGPFLRKCQHLTTCATAAYCKSLAKEMQTTIVAEITSGIPMIADPLHAWLNAIQKACDLIEEESKLIYAEISSVEVGIRLGYDLMTQVSWKIPNDDELRTAIHLHLQQKNPGTLVSERRIRSALLLTTPRDKRTLIELIKHGQVNSKPARLLLGRVTTLLKRDIRREYLNEAIRELSVGEVIADHDLQVDHWYWLEEKDKKSAYIYAELIPESGQRGRQHRFVNVDSAVDRIVVLGENSSLKCRRYIPVAESIVRAQRCYMNIELDHGHKFKYNAFMEFMFLRRALRKLAVVSQIFCEELDNARLNLLREVQRSEQNRVHVADLEVGQTYYIHDSYYKVYAPFVCKKKYTQSDPEWKRLEQVTLVKVPSQSMIVIGGGPTGLITVIHCTESVLASGGEMKMYESRDAFTKGGSTFERAQIVRLDARWIAMLRYHLGTGFEDVFIPASGETTAQLGNTLPTQGFVELTIKDLECMLHAEVSRLWSKGVIEVFTAAKAQYDVESNSLTKLGEHLKVGDKILRRVDPEGKPSKDYFRWIVKELHYAEALGLDDLRVNEEYGVYIRQENAVLPFKLASVDLKTRIYHFKSLKKKIDDLHAAAHNLPSVYPKGTKRHADIDTLIVESIVPNSAKENLIEEFAMDSLRHEKFTMDVGHTHVVECIGKPHGSPVHFQFTTSEPYGVCCIQGLKVSMGMHNFGEKRWGSGLMDDFRSTNDNNTRIIGDFTKMVRQPRIAQEMEKLMNSENWKLHFVDIVENSKFRSLNDTDPIVPKLLEAVKLHAENAINFRRQTLQTRFFETGDNYYLGMEFTREYTRWKDETTNKLVFPLMQRKKLSDDKSKSIEKLRSQFMHSLDRLWYEATLEVIRLGDVYNPGAKNRVPRLHLINSYVSEELKKLSVGESFRIEDKTGERYEVLVKVNRKLTLARNMEGIISRWPNTTRVFREGDLTRSPDGFSESKVAIATFPVAHYVNFRTVRLNSEYRGYIFAFIGDEQSTPHFMRYSGLTGAGINCMSLNNFIKGTLDGVAFADRIRLYSQETNWSNSEVVQRGTMTQFGEDSFLRPGFAYKHGLDYLHSKVVEWIETQQPLLSASSPSILTEDWLTKFAASMVPAGMELNDDFVNAMMEEISGLIFKKFMEGVKVDPMLSSPDRLEAALLARRESLSRQGKSHHITREEYWSEFLRGLGALDKESLKRLETYHCQIVTHLERLVGQIVDFAKQSHLYNRRFRQQFWNQPKPVDSVIDDFAVEAQNHANSLALSAAFSAASVAFVLYDLRRDNATNMAEIWGSVIAALNILLSFDTMTNIGRYKIRNEEARILFYDEKLENVKKAAYTSLDKSNRKKIPGPQNPFIVALEIAKTRFVQDVIYYDLGDPDEFLDDYKTMKEQMKSPAAIRHFQKLLSTYYIADVYQVNSYVQQSLVGVYKACEDLHSVLTEDFERTRNAQRAVHLFQRILDFGPRLSNSLQRGHIYFGFLKQRSMKDWDFFIIFRYIHTFFCCSSGRYRIPLSSIENETYGIIKEAKAVYDSHQGLTLKREIRDLEYLYWATRESDVASLIFVTSALGFIVSWIFTISRIVTLAGGPSTVTDVAFWASIASTFGAILAAFHFFRKLTILTGLWCVMGGKVRHAPKNSASKRALRRIRAVTLTSIILTFCRLVAAVGATVALPWSVAQNAFPDKITLDEEIPFWIALGSFSAAVFATIFFFIVEFIVRYNLSPKLGEYVCEAFRAEIESLYSILSVPENDIEPKQVQRLKTWEYVAREFLHQYRFDTVFGADRFGSILQYIQGGMEQFDPNKEDAIYHINKWTSKSASTSEEC